MIHSKYYINRSVKALILILFALWGLPNRNLQAQANCAIVDTVCTTGATDFFVNDDGTSTYIWTTNNGATLTVPAGDTLVVIDWSTSTVSNGLDSICLELSPTCTICRVSYLKECVVCAPNLFTQTIKRKGALTLCEILAADPTHPLASQDCDGGGEDNLSECMDGNNPEDPSDDCVVQIIVKDVDFAVWARTGALSTLDPAMCIDDININWGALGTWTQTTTGGSTLTFGGGTNSGDMICDNTGMTNAWEDAYNSTILTSGTSGCVSFTITEDEKSAHFHVGLTEEQSVIDGTWGTGYCQIYVDGNTQINSWRVTTVAPGFPANPFSFNSGWQTTGWTFPMSFDICIDASTAEYYVNKDGVEVARIPIPSTTTTCP